MRRPANPLVGLRGRVACTVLAVSAVLFSVLGTIGFLLIARGGRDAAEERIGQVLDDLEAAVRRGTGTVDVSTADGVRAAVGLASPGGSGGDSGGSGGSVGEIVVRRRITVRGTELLLVGRSSEARLAESLRTLHRGLWIAVPVASVLSATFAGLATRRALAPVGRITDEASRIGSAAAAARVPVPATGDEIEDLARTVNEMLDRIDAGRRSQRRFTSDAAHELRTPLMALQGEVELLGAGSPDGDDGVLERLDLLCRRLGSRIDDLVLLATLDEERPLRRQPVVLADVVRDEASAVGGRVEVAGPDVVAELDPLLVARATRNLLANARRHAVERVRVEVAPRGGRLWLHVDDDGDGVDLDGADRLFERFARGDESRAEARGGSGLGLAIVASVAAAHGGGVAIGEGPLGGARVSMWVPLQRHAR